MVGAELQAATGSAIATRLKARSTSQRRPAQSHLPLSTAVDLTDLVFDSRLIRIFPPPEPILTGQRQVGTGLKRVVQGGSIRWGVGLGGLSLIALTTAMQGTGVALMALATVRIRRSRAGPRLAS
jgi:hypothetical protein